MRGVSPDPSSVYAGAARSVPSFSAAFTLHSDDIHDLARGATFDRIEVPAYEGGKPVEVWTARSPGARDAEAQDAVQEAYLRAYGALGRFRGDAKLSTWIFRISKNQCINRLKYLKRRGRGRSRR